METIDGYLERLASSDPTPGGGSAAALVGSIAAALVAMAARKLQSVRSTQGLIEPADELRTGLGEARLRDEEVYGAYIAATRLPKGSDDEVDVRNSALESALKNAAEAPLDAAALVVAVLELTGELASGKMGALASDVACAAAFAYSALAGCAYNVRINHKFMRDKAVVAQQAQRLERLEGEALKILKRVRAATG